MFDRKKEADNTKKKGLLQIEVREKKTNKSVYLSTGIHLYKNQFSTDFGFTCKNHPNDRIITNNGRNFFTKIERFIYSDECVSLKDVRNFDNPKRNSFIEFMRQELARKNMAMNSVKFHNVLIRKVEDSKVFTLFSDLTYSNIIRFDAYLKSTISSSGYIHKCHSTIHSYIKESIKQGFQKEDPYIKFKLPPKKYKDPVFLDENEIQNIIAYKPDIERLEKVKDLFLFQVFTGLAYIDMQNFSREYIVCTGEDKIIRSTRLKTDETNISWFLPEAEEIAEKYNYDLPKISNQKYNDYLKLLATGAGIKKNLTTHVARHTYATYLLNKGVSLEVVSKAMGHSSVKMTQHYAKMLGNTVIKEMKEKLK